MGRKADRLYLIHNYYLSWTFPYFHGLFHLILWLCRKKSLESSLSPWQHRGPSIPPLPSSPGPCVLFLPSSLQEVQRVSWYWSPGTLVTFPCCSQSWWGSHGLVLEDEEEKKPWGQGWHWVFLKGVPEHEEMREPSDQGDKATKGAGAGAGDGASRARGARHQSQNPNMVRVGRALWRSSGAKLPGSCFPWSSPKPKHMACADKLSPASRHKRRSHLLLKRATSWVGDTSGDSG